MAPDWALAGVLGIGTIGVSPSEGIARLAPLADYLAAKLEMTGIDRGRVIVAESVFEMAELIRRGDVDLYFGSPLPAMAVKELAGIHLRLRCSGQDTHTVVFVLKDSGIADLEDLGGRMVAFESPVSTFGYLLPKLVLSAKGARLQRRDAASSYVAEGTVGYVFSEGDENTLTWVLRGKVAAGAARSDRYEELTRGRSEDVAVIYQSVPLAAEVVAVRSTLPSALTANLLDSLQNTLQDAEGRDVLQKLTGLASCEPLGEETLSPLENVQPFLRNEFGLP